MSKNTMHKHVIEILADAFSIGATMAGLKEHLRSQCYYNSDLINKDFVSAEKIVSRMDWVCENQKELCRCEVVLLENVLRDGVKLSTFDRYEGVSPCEYALLFYEGDRPTPVAVVITMIDDKCKLASIALCRNKELFQVDLGEDCSDKDRYRPTNPFHIFGQCDLCGKTVYLDQYPVNDMRERCANYMHSLDWKEISREAREKHVTYFDVSDAMDLFPHLQLDANYKLYCYISHAYPGLWGRVAAMKKDSPLEPVVTKEEGFCSGPVFELPEGSTPPMETIYNDGTPEGYFEALLAEKFFSGLPHARFERDRWDNCITRIPEDFNEHWRAYIDIPEWAPRVCFGDNGKVSVYACWREFENGIGGSDGKDRIYLRRHYFITSFVHYSFLCGNQKQSTMYKAHVKDDPRSVLNYFCMNNVSSVLIAQQK